MKIHLNNFKLKAKEKYIIHEEYSKNKRVENTDIHLFNGIKELVEDLSTKYILVVNSSDYENHIKERLEHNNILPFFDLIAGKETSTDKVKKFDLILKKYNLTSDQLIFVTDTIGDIYESDKVNIDSIAVTWGVHSRVDFEKQSFDKLIFISDQVDDFYSLF